jgi:hypothetical protein
MKVAIVGSRTYTNFERLEQFVKDTVNISEITTIISGGAKGVDTLAEKLALKYDIPTKIFYPNWQKYGKFAGPVRNEKIIKDSDIVIALWDGMSKGTNSSINLARKYNRELHILHITI